MNFSNESFDNFQEAIRSWGGEHTLLWELRDGLFGVLTHSRARLGQVLKTREALLFLPFGWIAYMLSFRVSPAPAPVVSTHHLLFLSPRSNHLKRVEPLLRELSKSSPCTGWVANPQTQARIAPDLLPLAKDISRGWRAHLNLQDFRKADREARKLEQMLDWRVPLIERSRLRLYVALFFAWKRFWQAHLPDPSVFVLTTYEKDPIAKSLLVVAKEKNVPQRIHWAHGLRHNSLQSTFASELWCLTEPDAEYFRTVLPTDCLAIYKPSPEGLELAAKIGILDEEKRREARPVQFLFLGAGFDPDYSPAERLADLQVIRTGMEELGDRVVWRFRPHPGNIPNFLSDLEALGIKEPDISKNSLEDDIRWSHAVGTPFSSVGIDAKLAGRELFWVHAEIRSLYSVDKLIAAGFGIHIDSKSVSRKVTEAFPCLRSHV
jgi:hypothetical protein